MNFLGGKLILWLKSDVEADLKVQEVLLAISINDQVDDDVDGDDCDNFCTGAALARKPLATSPSSGNPLRGNVLGHHHHHLDEMWTKVYKNVKEYWPAMTKK